MMGLLKRIIQYITHDIWVKKEHEYKSRKMRWAVRQIKVVIFTAQGFGQHEILVRSAALTFYTLMSLVPIAAMVFGIAKGFGLETRLNEYLYGKRLLEKKDPVLGRYLQREQNIRESILEQLQRHKNSATAREREKEVQEEWRKIRQALAHYEAKQEVTDEVPGNHREH